MKLTTDDKGTAYYVCTMHEMRDRKAKAYQQGSADKQAQILKILSGIDTQVERMVREILKGEE